MLCYLSVLVYMLCYLSIAFKAGNNLLVNISARSQNFNGSVASVIRGRVFGADDVYIHVIKTKCVCLCCFMALIVNEHILRKTEYYLEYSVSLGFRCP